MFSSTNQAIAFGLKATPKQIKQLKKNKGRYEKLFFAKMNLDVFKTDKIIDRLFLIASKVQFCQEALDAKILMIEWNKPEKNLNMGEENYGN